MAQPTTKRALPPKIAAMKARKRQKLENPTAVENGATKPGQAPSNKRRKVNLDKLQWKEVEMPDRLEDFEGFYGLEEIEDVEVVREDGQITFVTAKAELEKKGKKKDEGKGEDITAEDNADELDKEEEKENDDASWDGFSDEEPGEAEEDEEDGEAEDDAVVPLKISESKPQNQDGKSAKETKKVKESKEKKTKANNTTAEPLGNGAFDILAERGEESDEEEVDISAWEELGISEPILQALSKMKFSQPTTIQASTIPEILAGHDVIGKASTGSGKTLAFGIPIVETFLANPQKETKEKTPIALIISPTRELAHQLTAHITALCTNGDFDAPTLATVTGGLSVQKQRRQLEHADIIIGTPGRLWEVISSGHGLMQKVKQIKFLVVDEADRLLSAGQYKELGEILKILDKDDEKDENEEQNTQSEVARQTLVFSATFQKELQQKLAGKIRKGGDLMSKQESMQYLLNKLNFREEKPKFIDANPTSQMASGLKEGLIECAGTEKDLYLYSLLVFHPKKRALVFTNSISAVRRITPFLQNLNLTALPLHSSMPQKARLRSVERFTAQAGSILVATDVAARGLDIRNVELIVHYHLPRAADTYVHRSGRTARAEASGSSILICSPEEVAGVRRLIAKVHARSSQAQKSKKTAFYIRTLDLDRRIISRLKPRATLAKKLADAVIAKEKKHSEDDWMRAAAEELGVDYDSETFDAEGKGKRGRGAGRLKKEKEASALSKGEMQAIRAELRGLLSQRINTGVSEKYLTSGGIDIEALMKGEGNLEFLGHVEGLGMDDDE